MHSAPLCTVRQDLPQICSAWREDDRARAYGTFRARAGRQVKGRGSAWGAHPPYPLSAEVGVHRHNQREPQPRKRTLAPSHQPHTKVNHTQLQTSRAHAARTIRSSHFGLLSRLKRSAVPGVPPAGAAPDKRSGDKPSCVGGSSAFPESRSVVFDHQDAGLNQRL